MATLERAYKVVLSTKSGLYSCYLEKRGVRYNQGEWAHAPQNLLEKGYGLCVFPHLSNAEQFSSNTENKVFKCLIYNSFDVSVPRIDYSDLSSHPYAKIPWLLKKYKYDLYADFAHGTKMCESLLLLEEVK